MVAVTGGLVLTLLATACGSNAKSSTPATTAATGTKAATNLSATLNASGATFPKAFYDEEIATFGDTNKGVTINYGGGGSGKGRQDLADQITDWAGSDSPIADADKAKFKGGDVLYFPTVVAPITLSYNLDGVAKLQLSPETVAKIFQREITTWNDAAIATDNPGVTLPSTAIVVAHRSDGSGTTDNFTKFLDRSVGGDKAIWKLKSGSTVEWPADTQGAEGNGGVAKIVKDTKGAIGYVDLSDAAANKFALASVKNQAGKFVAPTLEATSAAVAGVEAKADLTFSASWAAGDSSYPIAAQTWVIVYKKQTDKAKGSATKEWIRHLLTDGQKAAPDINYAPLPAALAQKALAQLDQIEIPS